MQTPFNWMPLRSASLGQSAESLGGTLAGAALAQISLLYTSRDGRLCLFEDGGGHLTCVRSERLA